MDMGVPPSAPPEIFSFVLCAITQPFFELQTADFAWMFVWIVPTNYIPQNFKNFTKI